MRLEKPRIPPLPRDQIDPELQEMIGDGSVLNIFGTLAHHPKLMKRWWVFGTHVLRKSSLPPRERELVILRVGWLCQSGYEWGQHVVIGREAGVTDAEIERIKQGPDAPGWSPADQALLRAADELHEDAFITDDTWKALTDRYDTQQLLDLVFAVGQYHLVSMVLNATGVQLDPGIDGL